MEEGGQVSAFPLPPMEYIKLYTTENVSQGLAPAPPAPIQGHYNMFGATLNTEDEIVQPLETQGIRRLYPQGTNFDHKAEMKKLNHSILAAFLDLLEILIRCPGNLERDRKLDDIKLLFINMHHLINEYRSHQARETLRLMLEVQWQERLEIGKRFRAHFDAVLNNLKRCLNEVPEDVCSVVGPALANDNSQGEKMDIFKPNDKGNRGEAVDSTAGLPSSSPLGNGDALMCKIVDDFKL